MKLHNLPKTTTRRKKRAGRGYGSGKGGHTVGRGSKGQKARSKVAVWFEGGQLPLSKKLPFLKGKDRFKSLKPDPIIVHLGKLNIFQSGTVVTPKELIQEGIVDASTAAKRPIKILSGGKLEKHLTLKNIQISSKAQQALDKLATSSKSVKKTTTRNTKTTTKAKKSTK